MISTTFYERRNGNVGIDFDDQRIARRRNGEKPISPEQRRLASQIRRYEREAFKIPVRLKIQKKEISGYTHDISPEGLLVFSDTSLSPGTPMSLQFAFGDNVCSLNISGQVLFCRSVQKENQPQQAIGIKFSAVRDFEQKILTSAVQELKQSPETYQKSFLSILVSTDTLAQEASDFYVRAQNPLEKNKFTFDKTLYLTDTCALGNAYFTRYFEWQGMAREEFFKRLAPDPLGFFKSGATIMTIEAQMEYKHGVGFYDEIEIEVKATKLRKVSIELLFFFRNKKTDQIIAQGRQKLVFADSDGKFMPIPDLIRTNVSKYLIDKSTLAKSLSYYEVEEP